MLTWREPISLDNINAIKLYILSFSGGCIFLFIFLRWCLINDFFFYYCKTVSLHKWNLFIFCVKYRGVNVKHTFKWKRACTDNYTDKVFSWGLFCLSLFALCRCKKHLWEKQGILYSQVFQVKDITSCKLFMLLHIILPPSFCIQWSFK